MDERQFGESETCVMIGRKEERMVEEEEEEVDDDVYSLDGSGMEVFIHTKKKETMTL